MDIEEARLRLFLDVTPSRSRLLHDADLYYRLAVFLLEIPPLRARPDDLTSLVQHVLHQFGSRHLTLSPDAWACLRRYAWPGNVRELRNVVLQAVHRATASTITPAELSPELTAPEQSPLASPPGTLHSAEQELIQHALEMEHGHVGRAARRLGIHRTTLYRKIRKYGLG